MSRYGRLYEDARKWREALIELLPGVRTRELVGTLKDARLRAADHARRVQDVLDAWERIEAEMAKEPD